MWCPVKVAPAAVTTPLLATAHYTSCAAPAPFFERLAASNTLRYDTYDSEIVTPSGIALRLSDLQFFLDFSSGIIHTRHDKTQTTLPRIVNVSPKFIPAAIKIRPAIIKPTNPMIWKRCSSISAIYMPSRICRSASPSLSATSCTSISPSSPEDRT